VRISLRRESCYRTDSLPAAEEEVREVSTLFEKRLVLTGKEATKVSVKEQSPKYDLLLFLLTGDDRFCSSQVKSQIYSIRGDDGR